MKKILLFFLCLNIFTPYVSASIDSAYEYVLMDIDSGRVLASKNMNSPRLIASITKIMTCIVAIEYGDLTKTIEVGDEVLKAYGSAIYIEIGEKITLKDLLMGLMLRSGNDAAIVIANNIASSMDGFVMLMNEEAKKIGMTNTYFYNAHGLEESDGNGNMSTAYDMALLTKYAMHNSTFREIFSTKEYTVKTNYKTHHWINKNKLIHNYSFITGGKTGYTKKAHRTLVTTGSSNGINLVIVTLDDSNDFLDHLNLYKEIFKKYYAMKILDKDNIRIKNDTIYNNYTLYTTNNIVVPVLPNEKKDIRLEYKLYDNIKFTDNDNVGYVEVYFKNTLLTKENIYINVPLNKKVPWWKKVLRWFRW